MGKKITKENFKQKFEEKHGYNKYNYSKFEYVDNKTKGLILCNDCNREFYKSPTMHRFGVGCICNRFKKVPLEEQLEIIEKYKSGLSQADLKREYGLCNTTLVKIFKKHNISHKTMSEIKKVYSVNDNYFENIDNEDKAYFLGLMMADGSVHKNSIRINLQEKDKHILESFLKCIEFTGYLYFIKKGGGEQQNQFMLSFTSSKMIVDLAKYGIVPNKTFKTYFPNIPESLWHHFIRGYFDGDGHIGVYKKKNYYSSQISIIGNKKLIEQLQLVVIKNCKMKKRKLYTAHKNEQTLIFAFSGNLQIKRFMEYLYKDATIYLTRKKEKFYEINN